MGLGINYVEFAALVGAIGICVQGFWRLYTYLTSREQQHDQSLADRVQMEALQAEISAPHILEQLQLGNIKDAVSMQQTVITGLYAHARWQDEQIIERDRRIADLEDEIRRRDTRVEELERRVTSAERNLKVARRIIDQFRDDLPPENPETMHLPS